ncbi:hypothetical protein D3C73_1029820 [compost metagenome]
MTRFARCRGRWSAVAGGGRWWPVVVGGGRWWSVVVGGGRWWPVVAGGGRWWSAVAGGGRWWPVVAVGWVKRAPSAPRKQAPIARNPSDERRVVAGPVKNPSTVRWVTRDRQHRSGPRPDALHPSYDPSSHPIRHGMEYVPPSHPIRHGMEYVPPSHQRRHIHDNGIAPSHPAGVSPGGLPTHQSCVSVGDA